MMSGKMLPPPGPEDGTGIRVVALAHELFALSPAASETVTE